MGVALIVVLLSVVPAWVVRLRTLARHNQESRVVICLTLHFPVDACVQGLEFLRFESPLATHIRTTVAEEAEEGMKARLEPQQ
jgi:hypothetical protein